MKINWEAIAAIGQIAGAFATFLAVLVALKQSKPKVFVKTLVGDEISFGFDHKGIVTKEDILVITAVNKGHIPVTINFIGLKYSKGYAIINPDPRYDKLPKQLMPSEEVLVWTDEKSLREKGIKKFDIACAVDNCGRIYYCKVSWFRYITRFLAWKFGIYDFKTSL